MVFLSSFKIDFQFPFPPFSRSRDWFAFALEKIMFRTVPLVVILGSTGTGKTKLSVELARRFAGEIISADSMQVYRGLDIATAKATDAERAAAPHHLLDVALPGQPYSVVDFRDAALPVVEDLLGAGKMPIVVGGTNYYIESLLWRVLVAPPPHRSGEKRRRSTSVDDGESASEAKRSQPAEPAETQEKSRKPGDIERLSDAQLDAMSGPALHELLRTVDAAQAQRLHPNNRRKTLRALQVYRDCGKPMSAVLEAQQQTPGGSCLGGPLRYEHIVLLWLRCDPAVLDRRLDARIDAMVAQGLLTELRQFYDSLGGAAVRTYTKGILQTIGFKEFVPYLEAFERDEDVRLTAFMRQQTTATTNTSTTITPPAGMVVMQRCLNELRLVTKRYARKQIKWVANRFVANSGRRVPPIYELDTSDADAWQTTVFQRAENIVASYVKGVPADCTPLQRHESPRAGLNEGVSHICETCERTFVGEFHWRIHLRSNKHKRAVARKAKEMELAPKAANEENKKDNSTTTV